MLPVTPPVPHPPASPVSPSATLAQAVAPTATPAVASLSPRPAPRPIVQGNQPPPWPLLRRGSHGPGVQQLQEALSHRGIYVGPIDGLYGPLTVQAVAQFQHSVGLPADGIVGAATQAKLRAAAVAPLSRLARPAFSAAVPVVRFHAIAISPARDHRHWWVTGLSVVAMGGVGAGLKTRRRQPSVSPSPQSQGPLHRPEPIYPWVLIEEETPESDPSTDPPTGVIEAPPAPATVPTSSPGTQPPAPSLATAWTWPPAPTDPCLPDFLYDLNDPQSLSRLMGDAVSDDPQAPVARLGILPAAHGRTGKPYTYRLADDMGGCFCLQRNELWATQSARERLRADLPYLITVQRQDHLGRKREQTFAITLNTYELALAS